MDFPKLASWFATSLTVLCMAHSPLMAVEPKAAPEVATTPETKAEAVPWKASYRKASLVEKGLAFGYLAGATTITLIADHNAEPKWIGPVGPDTAIHNFFVASTPEGGSAAATTSDVILVSMLVANMGEAAFVYWGRDSPEAGTEMFWMNANAMSLALFLNTISKFSFARERPGLGDCYDNDDPECPQEPIGSFYSGHSSAAFAAAASMCAHEIFLPVYTESWTNILPCITMTAAAASVAMLRMTASKHYFTDVITGSLMGASVGLLYPIIGHYATFGVADTDVSVSPFGDQNSAGLSLVGDW